MSYPAMCVLRLSRRRCKYLGQARMGNTCALKYLLCRDVRAQVHKNEVRGHLGSCAVEERKLGEVAREGLGFRV